MARNYTQNLTPDDGISINRVPESERSIRTIRPSNARTRLSGPPRPPEAYEMPLDEQPHPRRWGVWVAIALAVLIVGAGAAFILMPSTTISVVPHTHSMSFDSAVPFTAYPAGSAATGTITYTSISQDFEDSSVVAASGTEHVEEKATGNITIYNNTTKAARYIKNTRFQAPNGLIFRIPASVDIPAKTAKGPGTATVTVFADQAGPDYNLPPTDKFTLPGLKSSPEQYANIYGKSTAAFTGGFSGERPAVAANILDAARAELRNRLNEKARELAKTAPSGTVAFPGLSFVTFESGAPTKESGGVRIHETAHVVIPVFDLQTFAGAVARAVSANAEGEQVTMRFSDDVAATAQNVAPLDVGQKPIAFSLTGGGQLVWLPDSAALASALAGKNEAAFNTVIQGFPAIDEAHAQITPFWQHAFPADPSKIKVTVDEAPAF